MYHTDCTALLHWTMVYCWFGALVQPWTELLGQNAFNHTTVSYATGIFTLVWKTSKCKLCKIQAVPKERHLFLSEAPKYPFQGEGDTRRQRKSRSRRRGRRRNRWRRMSSWKEEGRRRSRRIWIIFCVTSQCKRFIISQYTQLNKTYALFMLCYNLLKINSFHFRTI